MLEWRAAFPRHHSPRHPTRLLLPLRSQGRGCGMWQGGREPCPIAPVLFTVELERWQPQVQARQVQLSLEASDDLPETDSDWMRMSQALGNVMSNAIRCTDAGGIIELRAGLESGGTLAVSITDDGIRIDAADLPHVFDRFYRTDESRNRGGRRNRPQVGHHVAHCRSARRHGRRGE